jgi:DNA-binding NarL/FixJ family response regulator
MSGHARAIPPQPRAVKMVQILLADDHEVVRRGLRHLLEEQPGWVVCGEAADGRTAVELATKHQPDVAVLDISMPQLNGLEATRQLKKCSPKTEILVFTMHDSDQLAREIFQAGAIGYLLKSDGGPYLVAAIDAALRHKPFVSGHVSETILETYLRRMKASEPIPGSDSLTPREREILQLLAEGKNNKTISSNLGISVRTVETHRAAVMHKIGAKSIADLVRYAVRNGIARA